MKKLVAVLASAALSLQAFGAQFTLSWTDNSTNETGFKIERSSNGTAYSEIATVGANAVSYIDAGLPNSTQYWYRLRAYNAAGNSGYSNVATGTTPPPANTAPTVSDVANRSTNKSTSTGAINFTIGDAESTAASLAVTATSSNSDLVPPSGVVLGGTGATRTVTLTPSTGKVGLTTVSLAVSDGTLTATDSFVLSVKDTESKVVTSADNFVSTPTTPYTSTFAVEYDVVASTTVVDGAVCLSSVPPTQWSDVAAIVRFNNTGFIDARNGGEYATDPSKSVTYSPGLVYRIKMDVNVPAKTYSVTVTAPGTAPVVLATNFAFRTEQAAITSINHSSARVIDTTSTLMVTPVVEQITVPGYPEDLSLVGAP